MKDSKNALLIVDMQYDFMSDGAVACPNSEEIIDPIVNIAQSDFFDFVVISRDIHPPHHISFASEHEGYEPFDIIKLYDHIQVLWPGHCIQGTKGAQLVDKIADIPTNLVLLKGQNPKVDAYSLFMDNYNERGIRARSALSAFLHNAGIQNIYICGLARNVCVLWTAIDGKEEGFNTHLIWDLTRATNPNTDQETREICQNKHIHIVQSQDILKQDIE